MIKNINQKNYIQTFKWKLINFQLLTTKQNNRSSYLVFLLYTILNVFSRSFNFHRIQFLTSDTLNKNIPLLLGENWDKLFSINNWIIDAFIVSLCSVGYALLVIGILKRNQVLSKIIMIYYGVTFLLNVSFSSLLADNLFLIINGNLQAFFLIIKISSGIMLSIGSIIMLFLLFYDIIPVRKGSIYWNLSNYGIFLQFLFDKIRAMMFRFSGVNLISLCISLLIELKLLHYIYKSNYLYLDRKTYSIFIMFLFAIIPSNVASIIFLVTQNEIISTKVFTALMIGIILSSFVSYLEASKQKLIMPNCDIDNKINLYAFYFSFINTIKNEGQIPNILAIHKLYCNQEKCRVAHLISYSHIGVNDLTRSITSFFKDNSHYSAEDQILYELWKYELGMKVSLENSSRDYSRQHQYIIKYINSNRESDETSQITITQQAFDIKDQIDLDKLFILNKISESASYFQSIYSQLSKPKPQLATLTNNLKLAYHLSIQINSQIEKLNQQKKLDFMTVQLYSAYITIFCPNSKLNQNLENQLQRVRISKKYEYLGRIDKPCFYVGAEYGKVQQFNREAMKFLRMKKFELRDKPFQGLFQPKMRLQELIERIKKNGKEEKVLLFFYRYDDKLKKEQIITAYASVQSRSINNRPFYVIILSPRAFNANSVEILIKKQNRQLIIADRQKLTISSKDKGKYINIDITIKELYESRLIDCIKELDTKKSIRVNYSQPNTQITLHVMQKEQIRNDVRHLEIRVIHKFKQFTQIDKEPRITLACQHTPNFAFTYDQNIDDSLILQGKPMQVSNQQPIRERILKRFNTEINQKKLESLLVDLCTRKNISFSEGLKTYRLFAGELYNVDLEDKQAYQKQFEGLKPNFQNQKLRTILSNSFLKIFSYLILCILFGLVIFVSGQLSQNLQTIPKLNTQLGRVNRFSIEINRIGSIFRDSINGLYQKYSKDIKTDLIESYDKVMDEANYNIFNRASVYTIYYNDEKITGNLNQLYSYILEDGLKFYNTNDSATIENFQEKIIQDLQPLRKQEANSIWNQLTQTINLVLQQFNIFNTLFICLNSILMISLLLICRGYNIQINRNLKPLLLISETKTKRLIEEAENFKQCISMVIKNNQVQLPTSSQHNYLNNRRKKPKRIQIGLLSLLPEIISSCITVIVLLVILIFCSTYLLQNREQMKKMFKQSQSIVLTYAQLNLMSNKIELTKNVDMNDLNSLEQKISNIQREKQQLAFSTSLNEQIKKIYYHNSCQFICQKQFIQSSCNCSNTLPGFIIQNPYELGLGFYFRDQHYNLLQNINQTFACTGIFSSSFSKVFNYLGNECQKQVDSYLNNMVEQIQPIKLIFIGISCCYFIAIFLIFLSLQNKRNSVVSATQFFNFQNSPQEPTQNGNINNSQNREQQRFQSEISINNQSSQQQLV